MKVTLNIHPADGIRAYEEMYPQMAGAMGVDASMEEPVMMDVTNRDFLKAYSHRYPIGFSGDTIISWESLAFQPYFTATASNIGYGWWSHDIGGHMKGIKDDEMAARWLQFGVFSPIMRLHSSNSEFNGKEPWRYGQEICNVMKEYLRLRHKLLPYLYSMNYRSYKDALPLMEPMYYEYPECQEAYEVKNQYFFGSECIVAPITEKRDMNTGLAKADVWLPEGTYIDWFTHTIYQGNRTVSVYRGIDKIPVFLKEGAIVPCMDSKQAMDKNPDQLHIHVFPGKSNTFTLYEDDNVSNAYETGKCAMTQIQLIENEKTELRISAVLGDRTLLPEKRSYQISILGCEREDYKVYIDGKLIEDIVISDVKENIINLELPYINTNKEIQIVFERKLIRKKKNVNEQCFELLNVAQISFEQKDRLYKIIQKEIPNVQKIVDIMSFTCASSLKGCLCELLSVQ